MPQQKDLTGIGAEVPDDVNAAALLGMGVDDLRAWMKSGELEGIGTTDGLAVPWSELVSFGMDFWSQEIVEAALGKSWGRRFRSCCGSWTWRCAFRGCRW